MPVSCGRKNGENLWCLSCEKPGVEIGCLHEIQGIKTRKKSAVESLRKENSTTPKKRQAKFVSSKV